MVYIRNVSDVSARRPYVDYVMLRIAVTFGFTRYTNCGLLRETPVSFDPFTSPLSRLHYVNFLTLYTESDALSIKCCCGWVYSGVSWGCLWCWYHIPRGVTKHWYLTNWGKKWAANTLTHTHTHSWLCRHWHPSHLVKLNLSERRNSCSGTHVHAHTHAHMCMHTHSTLTQWKISWGKALVHPQTGMWQDTSDLRAAGYGRKTGCSPLAWCAQMLLVSQK